MKKIFLLILLGLFIFSSVAGAEEAAGVKRQGGAGIQTGLTGFGLSGKYLVMPKVYAQGIYSSWGIFGLSSSTITGRGLYILQEEKSMNIYAGGELSYWSLSGGGQTASTIGFGALVGLEYFLEGLSNLGFNVEVGYAMVSLPGWWTSRVGLTFGVGMIYYFM